MARNPKAVRRRYKAVRTEARRGRYTGPLPTYDQLNTEKPAYAARQLRLRVSAATRQINYAFRQLRERMGIALETVKRITSPAGMLTRADVARVY